MADPKTGTDDEPRDPTAITVAPDGRPLAEQPQWRQDFPVDWPDDHYVARRDFTKFLVLTSGAFVAGQAWIAVQNLVRRREPPPRRARIASLHEVPPGTAKMFNFPGPHDACLLICPKAGVLLAYSQKCTHLSCAVVPRIEEGVLHCPCHESRFDLYSGQNIAGPPPRPLPRIELEIDGDEVYAISVQTAAV